MKKAVFNVITHPLTVCNLIIVGSLVFIEALHINFHKGLTQCEDSAIICLLYTSDAADE